MLILKSLKFSFLIILLLFSVRAYSDVKKLEAPFGLSWDLTLNQASEELILNCDNINGFEVCNTNSVPKGISEAELYMLLFDDRKQLSKIILLTKPVTGSDAFGSKGKELINKYRDILKKKYGIPEEIIYSGAKLYRESSEFWQCLNYEGCGSYMYYFDKDIDGFVTLTLESKRLKFVFESSGFPSAVERVKNNKKAEDSNAF